MAGPDQSRRARRRPRDSSAEHRRGDAEAGEDARPSSSTRLVGGSSGIVVGHGREGTHRGFWKDVGVTVEAIQLRNRPELRRRRTPAPRTTCSATSTAAGWPTTRSPPTGPPTARSGRSYDRAEEQVRDLITEAADGRPPTGHRPAAHRRPVRQLHGRGHGRSGVGVQPLLDELAADRRRRRSPTRWPRCSAACSAPASAAAPALYVDTDSKDSTRYLLHLSPVRPRVCPTSRTTATSSTPRSWRPIPRHIAADVRAGLRREPRPSDWQTTADAHRRAGDQAGRRALGRRQAPRRRPDLQPAHVRRPARRGARLRLGGLGDRAGHHPGDAPPKSSCASPTT